MVTEMDRLPGGDPGGDVAVLGAERRRRVSDALGEAYSPGTRDVYRSHWARWTEWTECLGVRALPASPVHVAAFLTDRAEEGCRPATLRAALAAIAFAHRAEGLDSPTEDEGVVTTMRGLSRMLGRAQRQAPGLTRDRLAAIRAVACLPRRGRGGRLETPAYARRRGLVDIALASVMRDGLLRRGEAAAATWSDVTWESDGSGLLLVRRSKTDPEGLGTVCSCHVRPRRTCGRSVRRTPQETTRSSVCRRSRSTNGFGQPRGRRAWATSSRATAREWGWRRTSPDRA